jgi:hypothetical protein
MYIKSTENTNGTNFKVFYNLIQHSTHIWIEIILFQIHAVTRLTTKPDERSYQIGN